MQVANYYQNKVAVVTGAASGIGLALSEALLRGGATVLLADRDMAALHAATKQLAAWAARAHAVVVDVARQEQVQQLLQDAVARGGRLDLLFNNAGIGYTMKTEDATLEDWRRVIDINLWGVVYGVHAALPIMRRQGSGHIVTTASIAGLIPCPFQALYCTTKYAVVGLSESLRVEYADQGIHFSVVCPGNVATAIFKRDPPPDAIPVEEAARIIMEDVARHESIIALPETAQQLWLLCRTAPEEADKFLLQMARERRAKLQATGSYY
jgi:NAD(P)-dependent dehydrogenase (short-subunit alcohol dehydrogenase family)